MVREGPQTTERNDMEHGGDAGEGREEINADLHSN